jgi:hypothetical protein
MAGSQSTAWLLATLVSLAMRVISIDVLSYLCGGIYKG